MKKLIGYCVLVLALNAMATFLPCLYAGQPSEPAMSPNQVKTAQMEKEAVSKVLLGRHFTPPAQLSGPNGVTYYVGVRSLVTNSLEEVIVAVSRGSNFTVDLNAYRRDREESPWVQIDKSIRAPLAKAEQLLRDELKKELALEEKAK